MDVNENILELNEDAHAMFGCTTEELARLHISEYGRQGTEEVQDRIDTFLIEGKAKLEIKCRTKIGGNKACSHPYADDDPIQPACYAFDLERQHGQKIYQIGASQEGKFSQKFS